MSWDGKVIDVTLMGHTYKGAVLHEGKYAYGEGLALTLTEADGEPLATATVYMRDAEPAQGCVWIKDWSENEGMLGSLVKAGVIEPTGRTTQAGFTIAHEGRVL